MLYSTKQLIKKACYKDAETLSFHDETISYGDLFFVLESEYCCSVQVWKILTLNGFIVYIRIYDDEIEYFEKIM